MVLNRSVLVLNVTFEPVRVTSAKRALILVCKGAATVEAVSKLVAHTDKLDIPIPDVIRLTRYRRVPKSTKAVSRKGILLRDSYTCQYCGSRLSVGELTMDHVIPKSRGGDSSWTNMATSCFPCNNKKSNRTPQEAGMALRKRPTQLSIHAKTRLLAGDTTVWDRYLFT